MSNSLFLILAHAAEAAGDAAAEGSQGGAPWPIFQIVAIIAIFYFLLIRPQQRRAREQAAVVSSVKTGDRVIMVGGMHGIVTNVKDDTILVKVADNVKIEFNKSAVGTIVKE